VGISLLKRFRGSSSASQDSASLSRATSMMMHLAFESKEGISYESSFSSAPLFAEASKDIASEERGSDRGRGDPCNQ